MESYEFSIILAHPPDRWRAAKMLSAHPDLRVQAGWHEVAVQRHTSSLAAAVVSAIHDLESFDLRPLRICDGDWLTLADVGARIGRTREALRLWSIGKQGPGGFPPPLNPGCDTRFYSWAEVSHWLRFGKGYDLPLPEPILVVANLLLQARQLATRVSHTEPLMTAMLAPHLSSRTTVATLPLPAGNAGGGPGAAVVG
jgi:hypothetical protein